MRRTGVVLVAVLSVSFQAGAVEHPDDASWRSGQAAVGRQAWGVAAAYFHTYRSAHPTDVAGWVMEAWSNSKGGNDEKADGLFRAALDLDPSQPDALYHMANRAWYRRDIEEALSWTARFSAVPAYLERDYNHLRGVLLVMGGQDPERAVAHLTAAGSNDAGTQVLLGLALVRLGRYKVATGVLERVCPRMEEGNVVSSWMTCLDVEYCGELLEQRLEILRHLFSQQSAERQHDSLWDVVRVHLRHRACPGSLQDAVVEETVKAPDYCWAWLLKALGEEACPAVLPQHQVCVSLERAQQCGRSGIGISAPRMSGPLFEPVSGAVLDVRSFSAMLDQLVAAQCLPLRDLRPERN